jgi:hypothetical protein
MILYGRGLPNPASPSVLDLKGTARALSEATMFRISQNGHEPVIDVSLVDQVEPALRAAKAGRYHLDEISADPLPSGHTSRRWGVVTKGKDGSATFEPDPWADAP